MPRKNSEGDACNTTPVAANARSDERRYAQRILLDRIHSSTNWIGSSDLKTYVERHCSWAEYGSAATRSRSMDNWLKKIRDQAEDSGELAFDNKPGKGYRYRASKSDKLTLETANLVLLAERLLQPFLPHEHVESGLQSLFIAAHAKLSEHEKKMRQKW